MGTSVSKNVESWRGWMMLGAERWTVTYANVGRMICISIRIIDMVREWWEKIRMERINWWWWVRVCLGIDDFAPHKQQWIKGFCFLFGGKGFSLLFCISFGSLKAMPFYHAMLVSSSSLVVWKSMKQQIKRVSHIWYSFSLTPKVTHVPSHPSFNLHKQPELPQKYD